MHCKGKNKIFILLFPIYWSSYYQSKPDYYSLPYELQLFFSLFDKIAKVHTSTSWLCTFKHNKLLICCCSTSPGLFVRSLFSLSIQLNFYLWVNFFPNNEFRGQNRTKPWTYRKENSLLRKALQKNKCLHIMECHLVTAWYLLAFTSLNLTTYT